MGLESLFPVAKGVDDEFLPRLRNMGYPLRIAESA